MSEQLHRLSNALLGRYVVEREVGVGGAARVYSAFDAKHDRHVALKVLRPELGASVTAERFNREVKLLGQLRHPNILTLIDSGEADGSLFYVMPFIEGQSLRDVIHDGPAPIGDAVRLLRDVVDALAYAHRKGLVHRDVKPENVLVDDRHALVTDFGIARAVAGDPDGGRRLTMAGRTLGSPNYMAPEQVAGNPDADARSDIYAFGVMAYELLAGQLPYGAKNAAMMLAAHLNEAPVPLGKVRPDVPPALQKIVMRCLEKDPGARWKSTDELLHALEALTAPQAPAADRPKSRLSPAMLAMGAVVLVAIAFGVWGMRAQQELAGDRWAHGVMAPRIRQLLGADSIYAAWRLTQEVEAQRPNEDAIAEFWPRVSTSVNLFSEPAGARVSVCVPGDTAWVSVGATPLQNARLPKTAAVRLRLEKAGFATLDTLVDYRTMPTTFFLARSGGQ